MNSYLIRGTAADGFLRVLAADTTTLVGEASRRHHTSSTATAALGRSLTASLLLAQVLTKREGDRVTLRIQGDGPLGWIVAEGSETGGTRGYVRFPEAELPPRASDGKLDVGGLVGEGDLAVTRLLENGEPYTGSVPLASGEIAEDVAAYLGASEQIPSAVLLGVLVDDRGVASAGGVLVQVTPDAPESALERLEANLAALGQFTARLRSEGILGVVERVTEGLGFTAAGEALALEFRCRCSLDKALGALGFFGAEERADMIASGGQEVVCHWCNERYHVSPAQIEALQPAGG